MTDRRHKITYVVCALAVCYLVHSGALAVPGIGAGTPGPFRALIVYEGVDMPINSDEVLKYLDTHCIKGSNGPDWRQWPKTIDAKNDTADFKRLLAMPADGYPWAFLEHPSGRTWSGKFPESAEDQLSLFRKWGGE